MSSNAIRIEESQERFVVTPTMEVSSEHIVLFKDAAKLVKQQKEIIIDLSQVRMLNSTGIGVLLLFREELGLPDGTIQIHGVNETIKKLLHWASLDQMFVIKER
uniref:Putative anti-sigma factor antagonist n=1 Tax=Magnetococcus massalia (strain MO-1) TaxID=451514 RepID=A0A1S7LG45_MAGMO|nr:putative anti-sigma factor antagonist [Candidatus Magnetococcus massalia]